ncbi:MAG: hypothetical protein M1358_07355 [Chloroflexi bacterium]|nr:hypothetical protein [Chloroflexota bacterium]
MENLESMSKEALLADLKKAEDNLDDVRDERDFTLGQTGVHLGASRVEYLRQSWEREERQLLEKINLIKSRLQELG